MSRAIGEVVHVNLRDESEPSLGLHEEVGVSGALKVRHTLLHDRLDQGRHCVEEAARTHARELQHSSSLKLLEGSQTPRGVQHESTRKPKMPTKH